MPKHASEGDTRVPTRKVTTARSKVTRSTIQILENVIYFPGPFSYEPSESNAAKRVFVTVTTLTDAFGSLRSTAEGRATFTL